MSGRLTREAYEKLIAENLAWLDAQPHSLEAHHIRKIVERSAEHEYELRPAAEKAEAERADLLWRLERAEADGFQRGVEAAAKVADAESVDPMNTTPRKVGAATIAVRIRALTSTATRVEGPPAPGYYVCAACGSHATVRTPDAPSPLPEAARGEVEAALAEIERTEAWSVHRNFRERGWEAWTDDMGAVRAPTLRELLLATARTLAEAGRAPR